MLFFPCRSLKIAKYLLVNEASKACQSGNRTLQNILSVGFNLGTTQVEFD